jgi:hypothetical protein
MDNITDRILCIGDNWTAGTIENDVPVDQMVSDLFPLWPELLAEKMNMGYVNLSCGGRGNEWIYNRVIDNWNGEKIVIVLWAQWDRWDFCRETFILNQFSKGTSIGLQSNKKEILARRKMVQDALLKADFVSAKHNLEKSMRWMYSLQNFCKVNNIKYIQGQTFYPSITTAGWGGLQHFAENKIHTHIDEDNFIGWPIYPKLGGFTMSDKLNEVDPEMKDLRVSDDDGTYRWGKTNPNEDGHKLIAKVLYDYYQNLYG